MPKTKKKISTKRRNIYLGLTLAFFLGLIAIFVFDGYMGIYDNISVTTQEREHTIAPERWLDDDYEYYTWLEGEQDITLDYELENRRLSDYTVNIEAAVWSGGEKLSTLLSETVTVGSFDSRQWQWTVDAAALRPADIPEEQEFDFSVIIERDGVERRIVVSSIIPVY